MKSRDKAPHLLVLAPVGMSVGCYAALSSDTLPVTTQVEFPQDVKHVYLPPFDYPDSFTGVSYNGIMPVGGAHIPMYSSAHFTVKDAQALRQSLVSSLQSTRGIEVLEQLPSHVEAKPGSATLIDLAQT